jgi:hypothetical protein
MTTLHDLILQYAQRDAAWRGYDWWQLNAFEETIFQIDKDRFPLMLTALDCYQSFMQRVQGNIWTQQHQAELDAALVTHKDIFDQEYGEQGFRRFGKEFAGLTFRECWKIWQKNEAWEQRAGVFHFKDE